MANAQNTEANKLSSGIAAVRRKPSALLKPATDKLLEKRDKELAGIEAELAKLDAGAAPAPAPAPPDIDKVVDAKIADLQKALEATFTLQLDRATADLRTQQAALVGYLDVLKSAVETLTGQLMQVRERIAVLEQSPPTPSKDGGSKRHGS